LCIGAKTLARQSIPSDFVRGASGRFYVNDSLQLESNVFAIGDCCLKEPQTVVAAMKQGGYVANVIQKLVRKQPIEPYQVETDKNFIALTTGENSGIGFDNRDAFDSFFGADVVVSRKSKDLMSAKWWEAMNLSMDEKMDHEAEIFQTVQADAEHVNLLNKRKSLLQSKKSRLTKVLSNPVELEKFKQFLIRERSSENLIFYLEVQRFKEAAKEAQANALRIFEDFCLDTAETPVNLTSDAYNQMRESYIKVNERCWGDLFNTPENEIFQLMLNDSFTRYEKEQQTEDSE
jgi:hypothetical protein